MSASMRSDTQQRLPALPSLAREDGCTAPRLSLGGLGDCGWQGPGKKLVCWLSLKAQAVELTEAPEGPKEQVAGAP